MGSDVAGYLGRGGDEREDLGAVNVGNEQVVRENDTRPGASSETTPCKSATGASNEWWLTWSDPGLGGSSVWRPGGVQPKGKCRHGPYSAWRKGSGPAGSGYVGLDGMPAQVKEVGRQEEERPGGPILGPGGSCRMSQMPAGGLCRPGPCPAQEGALQGQPSRVTVIRPSRDSGMSAGAHPATGLPRKKRPRRGGRPKKPAGAGLEMERLLQDRRSSVMLPHVQQPLPLCDFF